ncbi:MAG: alpha/beta hydrolase family protein [Mangrovibacterium sp.]
MPPAKRTYTKEEIDSARFFLVRICTSGLDNPKELDEAFDYSNACPICKAGRISWMKYDPAIEITKLKIPLLLIQGTTDLQVTVNDAELLFKSKPDAQLAIIENMNHVLKESSSDMQEDSATYRNPELPLKPELVDKIIKFVNIK